MTILSSDRFRVNLSGTIAAAGVPQLLAPANLKRSGFGFHNLGATPARLWFGDVVSPGYRFVDVTESAAFGPDRPETKLAITVQSDTVGAEFMAYEYSELSYDDDYPLIGYDNIVGAGTTTTGTADANNPAANLFNPATFLYWQSTATSGTEYITITPTDRRTLDYVAMVKGNMAAAGISVGLEAKRYASDPFTTLVQPVVPTDDGPLLFTFPEHSYYQLRLVFTLTGVAVRLPVLYAGKLLVLERKIYTGHAPMNLGPMSVVSTGRSTSGNFLGRLVLQEKVAGNISLENLDPDWVRVHLSPFIRVAPSSPFFFAWRPKRFPDELAFCWTTSDIVPQNTMANGLMAAQFDVEGIV